MGINLMIDLETLDTKPTACVIEIGAILFDDKLNILHEFESKISIQDNINKGRTISESTLKFWFETGGIERYFDCKLPISIVINDFKIWLSKNEFDYSNSLVYSNSPNFDMVILENLMDYNHSFKFWNYRDLRTIKDLKGVKLPKQNSHSALEDCVNQLNILKNNY